MKQTHKTGKSKALTVLNTFLAIILALMLCVTALAHNLMNKMNRVDYTQTEENSSVFPTESQLSAKPEVPTESAISTEPAMPTEQKENLIGAEKDIINIMLIGQDRREGEGRARSDTMILLTINKNTKSVTMTSFLRDLYVEIPGYGSNRLNASYAFGGMELLGKTMEHNFGIYVDGNVEVDFSQFAKIVDLVGGVNITLRSDEAWLINSELGTSLTEGKQHLNGNQALSYARIRMLDADGDFSRTQRQRTLINAIVQQVKDNGIVKLLGIVEDVLPMVTTDMSNTEILGYATALLPMITGVNITNQRIPADGAYSYASVNGMSVLKADMEVNRQILRETLGG